MDIDDPASLGQFCGRSVASCDTTKLRNSIASRSSPMGAQIAGADNEENLKKTASIDSVRVVGRRPMGNVDATAHVI